MGRDEARRAREGERGGGGVWGGGGGGWSIGVGRGGGKGGGGGREGERRGGGEGGRGGEGKVKVCSFVAGLADGRRVRGGGGRGCVEKIFARPPAAVLR